MPESSTKLPKNRQNYTMEKTVAEFLWYWLKHGPAPKNPSQQETQNLSAASSYNDNWR